MKSVHNLVQSLCNGMLMQHGIQNKPLMFERLTSSCSITMLREALICT